MSEEISEEKWGITVIVERMDVPYEKRTIEVAETEVEMSTCILQHLEETFNDDESLVYFEGYDANHMVVPR